MTLHHLLLNFHHLLLHPNHLKPPWRIQPHSRPGQHFDFSFFDQPTCSAVFRGSTRRQGMETRRPAARARTRARTHTHVCMYVRRPAYASSARTNIRTRTHTMTYNACIAHHAALTRHRPCFRILVATCMLHLACPPALSPHSTAPPPRPDVHGDGESQRRSGSWSEFARNAAGGVSSCCC